MCDEGMHPASDNEMGTCKLRPKLSAVFRCASVESYPGHFLLDERKCRTKLVQTTTPKLTTCISIYAARPSTFP